MTSRGHLVGRAAVIACGGAALIVMPFIGLESAFAGAAALWTIDAAMLFGVLWTLAAIALFTGIRLLPRSMPEGRGGGRPSCFRLRFWCSPPSAGWASSATRCRASWASRAATDGLWFVLRFGLAGFAADSSLGTFDLKVARREAGREASRMVDQNIASWNRVSNWLRQVASLRQVA